MKPLEKKLILGADGKTMVCVYEFVGVSYIPSTVKPTLLADQTKAWYFHKYPYIIFQTKSQ